jgi:hypothetical protein
VLGAWLGSVLVDLGREVGDAGVEGVEESGDGGPADIASSVSTWEM